MAAIIWTLKNIVDILKERQVNEFDGNIAVSGDRGNGKSTIINKIFYRLKGFNPWKHQVYSREDVIKLLKYSQFSLCMDDEAINSGYKREFQNKGQQEFIKILNAYRDNFNIFASAIPNFFSLDKDLRDLYFIHLHIIERGLAIVHMPLQGRLYSQDRWDAKYNAIVEMRWSKRILKNPNFRPAYHKLTTFRGYLYFKDLTEKQKALYILVKKTKREEAFLTEKEKIEGKSWIRKIYDAVINLKLTNDGLLQACLVEGKKYSAISQTLNGMLKDDGRKETLSHYLSTTYNNQLKTKKPDPLKAMVSY